MTLEQPKAVWQKIQALWKRLWAPVPRYLLLCIAIPPILMYLIYLAKGIHPFGDGCVLVLDLNGQYVWFFEALRNFVKGDASLLYSFSRSLGGEFLGMYAYYLASPLSYLLALFPRDRMLEGLLFLFLLKTAICGGTFGYYMHKTMKTPRPVPIVIFSVCYALSAYAVVQQHNTMWIDALMWLPLITLGIEELIKYGRFKRYTIFLGLTLISNFYIGYMVCIYCLLYFFAYYIAHGGYNRENNPLCETRHFPKTLLRMALYSVIAVGIAAIILLGAYYSLNFGKTTFSNPKWEWEVKMELKDLFYKFLPGSYDTVRPNGLPFVYCGVLTLLLLPAYFFSRNYSIRQKIVSAVFILIFLLSFLLSVPDLIWHGFQKPNWLNYRYSFMLCFYLCVLACRTLSDHEKLPLPACFGMGGLLLVFAISLRGHTSGEYVKVDGLTCVLTTVIAVLIYLTLLFFLRADKKPQLMASLLLGVTIVEVFLGGLWNVNGLDDDVNFTRYSYYNGFLDKTRPIVEQVQEADSSFYRMEKTFFRKFNDNMAFGIRGLSGSTSTLNKETIMFLEKMGYRADAHRSKSLGGTPVNDSLLGLKYIISDNPVYGNYYSVFAKDEENGYTAYYNPYSLSIAYGVDEELMEFPLGFLPAEVETDSAIASMLASVKGALNRLLNIDETVNSAEYEDEYASPFARMNAILSAMLGEEVEVFVPVEDVTTAMQNLEKANTTNGQTRYEPSNNSLSGVLTYSLEMPVEGELFFYAPATNKREVALSLSVNDGEAKGVGRFNGTETRHIISLGWQEANADLDLKVTLKDKYFYVTRGEYCFYYIDWAAFKDVMGRLAQDQLVIEDYTESSFEGSFTASRANERVLTTLPYDKGWKIYVDGEAVETEKALGALVSFRIEGEAGDVHSIRMVYRPNVVWVGLSISCISLALLILLTVLEKRIKKIKYLRTLVSIPECSVPKKPDPEEGQKTDKTDKTDKTSKTKPRK